MSLSVHKRSIFLGVSMAASWAWGVSIVVGLTIIMEQGTLPFLIWAIANSLTIPLFGWMAYRLPKLENIVSYKGMRYLMGVIQVFALWVQCQAIFEMAIMANMPEWFSRILSMAIGLLFVILVIRDGLNRSMFTDQIQWGIVYVGLIILLVWGALNGTIATHPIVTSGSINWAIWSCVILFSGPFLDLQQWQRARLAFEENQRYAFLFGGMAFAGYMGLVYLVSYFEFSQSMTMVLLIVSIMVATSTLDSASAALQEIAGVKLGIGIGMLAIIIYPLVVTMGLLQLWTFYGTIRLYIVMIMIPLALYLMWKEKSIYKKSEIKSS